MSSSDDETRQVHPDSAVSPSATGDPQGNGLDFDLSGWDLHPSDELPALVPEAADTAHVIDFDPNAEPVLDFDLGVPVPEPGESPPAPPPLEAATIMASPAEALRTGGAPADEAATRMVPLPEPEPLPEWQADAATVMGDPAALMAFAGETPGEAATRPAPPLESSPTSASAPPPPVDDEVATVMGDLAALAAVLEEHESADSTATRLAPDPTPAVASAAEGATVMAPSLPLQPDDTATRLAPDVSPPDVSSMDQPTRVATTADVATRPVSGAADAAAAPPPPRSDSRHPDALPVDHELLWYRVEKVLGVGGFGITYKALDTKLDTAVAVKEFLPTQLMTRGADLKVIAKSDQYREVFEKGRDDFLEEARTLAKFKHANIVRVLTFFEEHGTAYMVMEYEEGEPLSSVLKRQRVLEEPDLVAMVMPLLQGLMALHEEGFIHRDIKPDNIFLRAKDSTPVLLDFGAARRTGVDENMTAILTPHYAPLEQYFQEAKRQGPWTDIYAMAAVMYHAVTGKKPPQAPQRSDAIMRGLADPLLPAVEVAAGQYNKAILKAIDLGLAVVETNRPRTIKEWLAAAEEEGEGGSALSLQELLGEEEAGSSKMRLALGVGAVVLAAAVGLVTWQSIVERPVDPAVIAAQQLAEEVRALRGRAEAGEAAAMYALGEYHQRGRGVARDASQALNWFKRAAEAGHAGAAYHVGMAYLLGEGAPRDDGEAAHWFKLGAEGGEAGAQYRYAEALELGAGVEQDGEAAMAWYRKAADQGQADAQYRLGLAHELGEGMEADPRAALDLYMAAAQQGQPEAQLRLGAFFAAGIGTQSDRAQAVQWYHTAAEQGLAEAQYLLGIHLATGDGVERNLQEAAEWFRRAAEQGHAEAQLELGLAYEEGQGISRDPLQAVKWYRQAAAQDLLQAQLILAAIYFDGKLVAGDPAEAARWFRRAAELGSAEAQNSLGAMYRMGEGVPRDPVEARRWFGLAAEQGYAEAENNLGHLYEAGLGVSRDPEEAVRWYRLAAAKGHPEAQRNLGWMYEEGRGVPQSYHEAAKWYALAAEQGDMRAQNTLGWMYEEGRGVPRDPVRALTWYTLAAVQDYADAQRNMELLGRRLSDEQRLAAQRLARAWLEARAAARGEEVGGGEAGG